MAKLTQIQINKIGKDFFKKIRDIDILKISNDGKICLIREFLEGYKRGLDTCIGTTCDTREIDIIFGIDSELAMFYENVGKVEPGIETIELIAGATWREIIKMMKK